MLTYKCTSAECKLPEHFDEVVHCYVRLAGDVVKGVLSLDKPTSNHAKTVESFKVSNG